MILTLKLFIKDKFNKYKINYFRHTVTIDC